MHDTSTEYKQMHNKTISWNDNWILIFIFFMGRLLLEPSASSSSSFMVASFLIEMIRRIRSSSRVESFIFLIAWGIFFGRWELDNCSHILFSSYDSSFFFFLEFAESNHFLLAHIPLMNESHDLRRSFKVVIATSAFSTSSSVASSCSLIWETLVNYDCMVSAFWIFTFFNYFLKVIFQFMFFPSNSLVKK